ncbi:MAG TPA: response regulator [Ferruginibacter sp.]|nr:response regulator [Ferruginibacter sp.]
MVKILVVEDELIIAEDICNMLKKMGYVVSGNAMDAEEATEMLNQEIPDLVLLDINLGGKRDGITLAEEINNKYQVPFIFITSYTDGPTIERAKKVTPANYLVKPFKPEQLYTAIEIALFNLAAAQHNKPGEEQEEGLIIKDALFIKEKYSYTKVNLADIRWIKAEGNYLELHLADKKELIRSTLSSFLEKLNSDFFFRTHKSYAVNLRYLNRLEPSRIFIGATEIPVTKSYADDLLKRLQII